LRELVDREGSSHVLIVDMPSNGFPPAARDAEIEREYAEHRAGVLGMLSADFPRIEDAEEIYHLRCCGQPGGPALSADHRVLRREVVSSASGSGQWPEALLTNPELDAPSRTSFSNGGRRSSGLPPPTASIARASEIEGTSRGGPVDDGEVLGVQRPPEPRVGRSRAGCERIFEQASTLRDNQALWTSPRSSGKGDFAMCGRGRTSDAGRISPLTVITR
jgi:hypothetical protein